MAQNYEWPMEKSKPRATERVVNYQQLTEGCWIIPSEKRDICLASSLLPSMDQDKLSTYETGEGFHGASMPEYFEVFQALYDLRESGSEVEQARQFIRESFRNHNPKTLTRLVYAPKGRDRIIHNYKTNRATRKSVDLVGEEGPVLKVLTEETSQALTGKTPEQVEELFNYITGNSTQIWRMKEKPEVIYERVAWFGNILNFAYLGGRGALLDSSHTFGVKFSIGEVNFLPSKLLV
jgi:hypothetical protein